MNSPTRLTFKTKRRRRTLKVRYLAASICLAGIAVVALQTGDGTPTESPEPPTSVATKTLRLPEARVLPAQTLPAATPANTVPNLTGTTTPLDLPIEPEVPGNALTQAAVANTTAASTSSKAGAPVSAEPAPDASAGEWVETRVVSGDNMSLIFNRLGLSPRDLHDIVASGGHAEQLKRLRPGQTIRVRTDAGKLLELTQSLDELRTLHITRDSDRFSARIIESKPDIEVRAVTGNIDASLFLSGQRAGLSDAVIMNLASIFAWDVDFVLDIREGDTFSVVYNEYWVDGKKIKDGEIIAAEFINQGRTLRAVRFALDGRESYFSDSGRSMRKAFLRSPVNFSRISSRFNLSRKHPILNKIRAHKGVDYAAPHGTPIKATGDGRIEFAGTKGGYGKTIVLRHGSQYETLYAHLSRFARGVRAGERVTQGQTIGYVGQSGLATGPHLHYEFHVNGAHRDPLKVAFPSAAPIPAEHLDAFEAAAAPLLAQLDSLAASRDTDVLVASLSDNQPTSQREQSRSGNPDI